MTKADVENFGYLHPRQIGGQWCALSLQIFTTGLVVGVDAVGYERRYCYERWEDALLALMTWDGTGDPPGPWIKVKGAHTPERMGPGCQ